MKKAGIAQNTLEYKKTKRINKPYIKTKKNSNFLANFMKGCVQGYGLKI